MYKNHQHQQRPHYPLHSDYNHNHHDDDNENGNQENGSKTNHGNHGATNQHHTHPPNEYSLPGYNQHHYHNINHLNSINHKFNNLGISSKNSMNNDHVLDSLNYNNYKNNYNNNYNPIRTTFGETHTRNVTTCDIDNGAPQSDSDTEHADVYCDDEESGYGLNTHEHLMSPSSLSASKNDAYFGFDENDNGKEFSSENHDYTKFTKQRQSFDIYDHKPKQENGMFLPLCWTEYCKF